MGVISRGRITLVVCLVAFVALLAAGSATSASSGKSTPAAAPKTLKIAMVTDLTGFFAPNTGWEGASAYFRALNAKGGIKGTRISLQLYDAGSDLTIGFQGVQRALAGNPTAFITGSGFLFNGMSALQQSGLPVIGEGFAPQFGQNIPSFFSVTGDASGHVSTSVLSTLKKQGVTKIALLTSSRRASIVNALADAASKAGMDVVLKDTSLPTTLQSADALSLAQRIVQTGAQGGYIIGLSGGIQVTVDLNQLGSKAKMIQTSEVGPAVIEQYGAKALEGAMFGGNFASPYSTKSPGVQEYVRDMKKYGFAKQAFNSAYAELRFAQAKFLVEKGLIPSYPNFSKENIIANLAKTKVYTAGGILPGVTFPQFQNQGSVCLSVSTVKNGKWVALSDTKFPFVCGGSSVKLG